MSGGEFIKGRFENRQARLLSTVSTEQEFRVCQANTHAVDASRLTVVVKLSHLPHLFVRQGLKIGVISFVSDRANLLQKRKRPTGPFGDYTAGAKAGPRDIHAFFATLLLHQRWAIGLDRQFSLASVVNVQRLVGDQQ